MKAQILNMIASTKTFEDGVKLAALKDDGEIDKSEEKSLKEVNKATIEYRKKLEKICK